MIYTVTLNPSIDYFVELERFTVGKTNRISREAKQPGGKGINVSRVLQRLGADNQAFGFIGGFTGAYIQDTLRKENISTDFIPVAGDTRINIKLRVDKETEINGLGPKVDEEEIRLLFTKLDGLAAGDVLVLSGSVPGSLPADFYARIAERLKERGVRIIVDATRDFLLPVLPYQPFLIKPNQDELGEMFGKTIQSAEEAVPYGKKLVDMGAENVIVSMGGAGALFFNRKHVLYASAPKGELKNSVGAGDSVVAGFLVAYLREADAKGAFRYAVAAGSATAFSDGFCTGPMIDKLLEQVHITQL